MEDAIQYKLQENFYGILHLLSIKNMHKCALLTRFSSLKLDFDGNDNKKLEIW